jgi:Ca2+-binding EF-hand superfamily protein
VPLSLHIQQLTVNSTLFLLLVNWDPDGMVDFDEFVAATLHVHQLEQANTMKWQHRSKAAFSKFDVDGDGYITASELKIVSTQTLVFVALDPG